MLATQVKRLDYQQGCVEVLEESLRRGQGTEANLLAVQKALQAEAADPVMRTLARAERAGLHGLMNSLANGSLTRAGPGLLGIRAEGVAVILGSERLREPDSLGAMHAWLLSYTTRLVEIAEQPSEAQPALLKELGDRAAQAPPGAIPLVAALRLHDLGADCQRELALLRSAAVAMALERYRLANGRWPETLAELTLKQLGAVPTDPYDGKPLRYARHKDVVVVYALGPDGKDDGGKPDRLNQFDQHGGYDVGFRLWDTASRRPSK
jgi:hypothetical protein